MKKIFIFLIVFLSFHLFAQIQKGETLDRIVAIVGKEIIMKSDIDGRLIMMAQQNPSLSVNDEKARENVLNTLIEEKLLITKAIEDSIVVSDEEIDQRWQVFLQTSVRRYGSEKRVEDVYGMSLTRLKLELKPEIKNQLITSKLVESKFSGLTVTQKEVEEFYRENKDSIAKVPPSVELYHIVREVEATNTAKKEAYNLAVRVRDSLLNGADFAVLAKKYSGDPGTASDGGNLGWFERGKLFPEFEKEAFKLQIGDISMPVETPFGYHIIETLDKKENSINTRHILFKIGQTTDDKEKTKEFLIEIRDSIINYDVTFEEMARKYSDDKDTKGFGGLIGTIPVNDLPSEFAGYINKLEVGEISEPIPYNDDPVKQKFQILYKKDFIEEHAPSVDNDYDYLAERAKMDKRIRQYDKWIKELKDELYWEIKEN